MKSKYYSIIFFILTLNISTSAQSIEGTCGLLFIPTAEMQEDGQIRIGAGFIPKFIVSFDGYKRDAITPFFTFSFLPFVEMNGRITRIINPISKTQGIGDRTISIRIRLISESNYFPAAVVGLHDLAGIYGGPEAVRNNSLYFVLSKHFSVDVKNNFLIGVHSGYGSDKIKAQHHNFVGLFGGMSLKVFDLIELMGEYDAERFNTGIRLTLFRHIKLLGGFMDLKYFSGGASFSFVL
ncbi:MAG: YjbH domain-containing protein [Melioribacter sp.]|nr:YjbH domain-containing protein [Melioribacter sp.]